MSSSTERKNRLAAREAGTDKKMLAQQEAAKKQAQSRRKWIIGSILVALLIVGILSFNAYELYKEAQRVAPLKQSTALTIGQRNFSAAEVNCYSHSAFLNLLSQYGDYASVFGLDQSRTYEENAAEPCPMMEEGTWGDYFLDSATDNMTQITALCDYAAANGVTLDKEDLAQVKASLKAARSNGAAYGSFQAFLRANYGDGVDKAIFRRMIEDSALASKAYQHALDQLQYTEQELEDYYQSLEGSSDVFSCLYYFVPADTVASETEDGEAVEEPTEETLAAAQAAAEAIVSAYEKGQGEDYAARFQAAVAAAESGSEAIETKTAGSSLNSAYQEWLMDASRKPGDAAALQSEASGGSYAVLFLNRDDNHYPLAKVRHILIKAEQSEDGSYSDEAKAAAKAQAEKLLAKWESGARTEDSFAELAERYSEDPGSNTNGGLYDTITRGQTVEEFDAFCFGDRQPGDTAIVYGESGSYAGYHVMYYVGEGEQSSDVIARNALQNEDMNSWFEELVAGYEPVQGDGYGLVG